MIRNVIDVNIEELRPAEYNPRTLSKRQREGIVRSLKKYGQRLPIFVNDYGERKGVIIGGNQRWLVAKEDMKWPTVQVIYLTRKTIEEERITNIRLNKCRGHWTWTELKRVAPEILGEVFDAEEMKLIFSEAKPVRDEDTSDYDADKFKEEGYTTKTHPLVFHFTQAQYQDTTRRLHQIMQDRGLENFKQAIEYLLAFYNDGTV